MSSETLDKRDATEEFNGSKNMIILESAVAAPHAGVQFARPDFTFSRINNKFVYVYISSFTVFPDLKGFYIVLKSKVPFPKY